MEISRTREKAGYVFAEMHALLDEFEVGEAKPVYGSTAAIAATTLHLEISSLAKSIDFLVDRIDTLISGKTNKPYNWESIRRALGPDYTWVEDTLDPGARKEEAFSYLIRATSGGELSASEAHVLGVLISKGYFNGVATPREIEILRNSVVSAMVKRRHEKNDKCQQGDSS